MTALYECKLSHVRPGPVCNAFTYATYLWFIDLNAPPVLRWPLRVLAQFDREQRERLDQFLASQGVHLDGGRVLMLGHARVLGHAFNPLTVYWCFDASGALECVVAEVHNTYGQEHCYLVRTDDRGRAETPKQLYVSPFYPVAGFYRMTLPLPEEELSLTITLHIDDGPPFVATLRGRRRRATAAGLLRSFLRHPMAPLVGAARIRFQGIKLFVRGLRVVPRSQEARR